MLTVPVKHALAGLLAIITAVMPLSLLAHPADTLPEMGTAAGSTLSVAQEMQLGDYYLRQLRGSAPLIDDPLLADYINSLGGRLVAQAGSVQTPFHFFLINNDEINAFAFFGGNVVLHSALFRHTDNESQLASVLAHEISHITQRHLPRAMEEQKNNAPLTWAGALGSVLLAMASPQAGMAALTGTLAGSRQGAISFTQQNEQEADRLGIRVLQRAGFDPQAMPAFLEKLSEQTRHATRPPEMLLTHPLPERRLADARNRAGQMPPVVGSSSQEYWLAKVRALGLYADGRNQLTPQLLESLSQGSTQEKNAARYGRALQAFQAGDFDSARQHLQPLLSSEPTSVWYVDLMTDIDSGQHRSAEAVTRLNTLKTTGSSPVLQLNLASALIEGDRAGEAAALLNRYTFSSPEDPTGWTLLAQAEARQGHRDRELAARAESLALEGKLDDAISLLKSAGQQVSPGSSSQARYDTRIDQLHALQLRWRAYGHP